MLLGMAHRHGILSRYLVLSASFDELVLLRAFGPHSAQILMELCSICCHGSISVSQLFQMPFACGMFKEY